MSVLQQYKFVQFFNIHSTFGFRISQRKKDNINKWAKFRDLLGDEFKKQLLYSYKSDLRNNNINYSKYKNIELGDKYYATNLKHSKTIDAGSGYLCQMEPVAHYGIRKNEKNFNVEVRWTDGNKEMIDIKRLNQTVIVKQK